MRNFSKVYLSLRFRHNFHSLDMTGALNNDGVYVENTFYIPIDAKMDGL